MKNPMKSSRLSGRRRSSDHSRRRKSFLTGNTRRLFAEQLETRVLLAGDVLHNADNPYDTDNNGYFSPADILHVINQINEGSTPASGEGEESSSVTYYNDVNGDGFVTPIDALFGINEYTERAEGEGELVSFRIQAVDVGTNNIINTSNPSGPNFHPVLKGTDYELRVVVDDLRLAGGPDGNPDGVYAAYMDLLYPKLRTMVEIQEIQTLTFNNNPEGGTFKLSFDTDGAGPLAALTTGNITYSNPFAPNAEFAIAANIQTALDTTFGTNRFQVSPVSAGDATQFSIRFMGQFGDTDVVLMTGNASLLTNSGPPAPTITFTEAVKGVYSPASFLAAFRFGAQYQSGRSALDGQNLAAEPSFPVDPNRISEVGAFYTSTTGTTGSAPRELFRVRMNTVDAGSVAFTGSLTDIILPGHQTLVFAGGNATRAVVDPSEIEIINSTPFTVTETFSAVNDSYAFAETSSAAVRNLTVMSASGGGQDTGNLTGVTISAISTTSLSVGTLAIAPGATSINFTQSANINNAGSPSTFTYTLRNATTGVTDTATVTINISAVNNAPVNTVPSAQTTAEEAAKVINGISVADIDASETANSTMLVDLTVQNGVINLASIPVGLVANGNGSATVNLQGSLANINTAINGLTYTPGLNFVGTDTFRIITNDQGNTGTPGPLTDNDTVAIAVTAVNDAPTLTVPGSVPSVLEGESLAITGTLTNDVDVGGSPLKVTMSVTGDITAALTLSTTTGLNFTLGQENGKQTVEFTGTLANVQAALGSFTYTPPLGDAGTQVISITVNDQGATGTGGALSTSGQISVDVIPLVRPFARRDPTISSPASVAAFTVVEGSTNSALPVLDNDLVDEPVLPATTTDKLLISVSDSPHGTTSISGDVVLYTPDADFWGTDTFTYVMNQDVDGNATPDGTNSTGTVTVTITNVNDAPVANPVSDSTNEDIAKDIVLSVSDIDDNNNVGFVSTLTPSVGTAPLHGTATVNANGTIRYTPALNYNGPDEFTYTVSDGTVSSGTATVTLNVIAVNDAPVSQNGTLAAVEDIAATGNLAATDVDSATLTYSLVSSANAHGTVLITNASTGAYTYTSDLNYNGPASFTFKANDGSLDSNVATVTITVSAVNDAPVANPNSYLVEEDTLLNANNTNAGDPRATVRLNDSDVDNTLGSLTVSLEPGLGPTHALLSGPNAFILNSDGSFRYQATLDYQGPDSFVYRLTDPSGAFSTATVSITVTEKNDPPVAVNDSYGAVEDVQLDVSTASGVRDGAGLDDDPDSNNPNSTLKVVLVSGPTHASVFTLNGNDADPSDDGAFSYKAAANYNGPDSFTYKLVDLFGVSSNTATVSINVAEVNDNPTANDDGTPTARLTLIKNTAASPFINQEINVTANDNDDPDFNVVENITIISAGGAGGATLHGTVTISGDLKKVLYTPAQDYEGPDEFTYTISDGRGGTATATVYIEVVNFIPTDITGTVYIDSNNNGAIDAGEKRLAGVKVVLQGHDNIFDIDFGADTDSDLTNDVAALVVYTDINGNYRFDAPNSLRPGMRPGSYSITEEQPEFMRDGLDTAGNNATLIANDKFAMTLPLLGVAGGINGNNFGERGLDPAYVSISEILASSTGNGLILAIDGSTQLWSTRLSGWANLKSCTCTLNADTSLATFTFTDMQNNVYVRTISQVGNPRFRIMGRNTDGDELIRLDGTAADFNLNLLAAGDQGQQPEGEADLPGEAGYVRGVDAVMAEVGNA
jgi:VCBS repeat-containing protein